MLAHHGDHGEEDVRRSLKRLLLRTGLYGGLWKVRGQLRAYDPRMRAANRRWRRANDPSIPVPPPRLIFEVVHNYDIQAFMNGGRERAETIDHILSETGFSLRDCESVLDFGCGCGRVIRHIRDRTDAELAGSDLNPRLIAWCRENLDFGRFECNDLAPPLIYPDDSFNLVYAISVLTHLDEELQNHWLAEFRRILKPGGALLVTTHGDSCFDGLDAAEARNYRDGQLVVRSASSLGSNLCETYHPPDYFRRVTEPLFDAVHHFPRGGPDRRAQDIWVLRTAVQRSTFNV